MASANEDPKDTVEGLQRERKMIEDGTHPTLIARTRVFQDERSHKEERAELERRFAVQVAEQMAQAEKDAAASAFDSSIEAAQADLIKAVEERLQDIQKSSRSAPTRGAARALRSKIKDSQNAGGALVVDPTLFPLRHSLEKNEVMDDLRAVFRDWKDTAERFQAETTTKLLPTRAEGRVLHFCSHTFNRGDAVVCISELTAQEFPGVFMGCNAVEAGLLLPDGTKCRIRLDHLRLGRLILKPAGDPDPVTARLLDSFRQPSFPPPTSDPPRPNASVTGYLPPRAAEIARERRHAALLVGRQAEAEVAAAAEAGMVPEHPTRHAAPADPAPPSQPPSPVQQPAPAPEHASVVPPAANSSSSSSSSSASFSEAGTADSAPPAPAVQAGLPPAVPPQLPPPAVTSSAASELADDEIRPGKRQRPDADASPAPQAPEAAPAPGDEHDGQAPAKRPREQADPHPAPPPDTASPLGGLAPAGEPPLPAEHAAPATEEPADPVGPPAAPEEPALGAAGAGPEPAITNAAAAPPAAEDAPSASVPAAETAPPADPTPAPAEPTPAPVEPAPQPGQDGAGAAPQ